MSGVRLYLFASSLANECPPVTAMSSSLDLSSSLPSFLYSSSSQGSLYSLAEIFAQGGYIAYRSLSHPESDIDGIPAQGGTLCRKSGSASQAPPRRFRRETGWATGWLDSSLHLFPIQSDIAYVTERSVKQEDNDG